MSRILDIGATASCIKSFTAEEVAFYCNHISGDTNQIHTNPDFAATTHFGRCIVPGIMVTSLFGGLLGSELPGEGTIHLGQEAKFIAPVYVGEQIKAEICVAHVRDDKPIATLTTTAYKSDGTTAISGTAVVKF